MGLKKVIISLVIAIICFSAMAQEDREVAEARPEIPKTARFDGVLKTKLETSVQSDIIRFNIRNSRMGVRGDIGEYLSYRVMVELSNEGVFQPLDLFGILKPTKNLNFLFGQQNIPFDNNFVIGPGDMMFANRTFIGKFFTPGTRDMGAVVHYKFNIGGLPMEGQAGIFNGGTINVPRWEDKTSYAMRLIAGDMTGFRSTAKIYKYERGQVGDNNPAVDYFFWGADARYANNKFRIETELMKRNSKIDKMHLTGGYIQGAYTFDMPNPHGMFRTWTPAIRFDAMGYDVWKSGLDVKRLTAGIHFGLTFLPLDSLLRIDYEQYFVDDNLQFPDFRPGRDDYVTDNKVTVELIVKF